MGISIAQQPGMYVDHIDNYGKSLSDWEKRFIANLMDYPPRWIAF